MRMAASTTEERGLLSRRCATCAGSRLFTADGQYRADPECEPCLQPPPKLHRARNQLYCPVRVQPPSALSAPWSAMAGALLICGLSRHIHALFHCRVRNDLPTHNTPPRFC